MHACMRGLASILRDTRRRKQINKQKRNKEEMQKHKQTQWLYRFIYIYIDMYICIDMYNNIYYTSLVLFNCIIFSFVKCNIQKYNKPTSSV